MPCYCDEIPLCQQDIQTIEDIRKTLFAMQNEANFGGNIFWKRELLKIASGNAITPDNIEDLKDNIDQINDQIMTEISAMTMQCSQKLSALKTALSNMQSDDAVYHANEEEGGE